MPELSQGPMDGSPNSAAEPLRADHAFIADLERSDGMAIDGREVGVFCPDCSRQEFGEDAY